MGATGRAQPCWKPQAPFPASLHCRNGHGRPASHPASCSTGFHPTTCPPTSGRGRWQCQPAAGVPATLPGFSRETDRAVGAASPRVVGLGHQRPRGRALVLTGGGVGGAVSCPSELLPRESRGPHSKAGTLHRFSPSSRGEVLPQTGTAEGPSLCSLGPLGRAPHPHRQDLVPNLQPPVLVGRTPLDDLGDVDAVVARNVLVPDAPRDAEAQTWGGRRARL